jgi:hypothetical protein
MTAFVLGRAADEFGHAVSDRIAMGGNGSGERDVRGAGRGLARARWRG